MRWKETEWEASVRKYHWLQESVEHVDRQLAQMKPTSKHRPAVEKRLAELENQCQIQADVLFASFGRILGVGDLAGYRKADFDEAMETCFGSLDQDGTGVFPLRLSSGVKRSWTVYDDVLEANRVFSLYLARKVLCPVSTKKKAQSLIGFFNTVTEPVQQVSGGLMAYFEEIVRLVFDRPDHDLRDQTFPVHSSSCVESSVRQGGKRQHFYMTDGPSFDRGRVKPVAIYTGGKVRVITIDSAWNMRYSFLNRYMAGKIRQAKWSVFGRSVSEWAKQCPEFFDLGDDEEYVSGDLESATDLISGDFARYVLRHLGRLFSLKDWEVEEMMSFTTDAVLSDEENGLSERQVRGQLMGSVLSFPILCLVSFCFATFGTTLSDLVMRPGRLTLAQKREAVLQWSRCAINGDDVVSKETDRGVRWAANVSDGGGRASRGKSVRNRSMFTINSEIWVRDSEGTWHPPCSIRPSLLCAMASKRPKNPAAMWLEYERSELLTGEFKQYFRVDRVLKVAIPTAYGGLGLVSRFSPEAFLEAWLAKKELVGATRRIRPKAFWAMYEAPFADSKKVLVECTAAARQVMTELLYSVKLPQWTEVSGDPLLEAREAAKRQYQWLTASEEQHLRRIYDESIARDLGGLKVAKVPIELSDAEDFRLVREVSFRGSREGTWRRGIGGECSSIGRMSDADLERNTWAATALWSAPDIARTQGYVKKGYWTESELNWWLATREGRFTRCNRSEELHDSLEGGTWQKIPSILEGSSDRPSVFPAGYDELPFSPLRTHGEERAIRRAAKTIKTENDDWLPDL